MPVTAAAPSPFFHDSGFRRFTVDEYHRLIDIGLLNGDDAVELLDGYLVLKMPHNPPHDSGIQALMELFRAALPAGWALRVQSAVTLAESEPEPDAAVVRGSWKDYRKDHPRPKDIALVVEVADSSVDRDRKGKGPIYAAAGIPVYWIVNIPEARVEVYSDPQAGPPLTRLGPTTGVGT